MFLPGKFYRQRSLAGPRPWGCCRKGAPLSRAPRAGSCLTLGKELSEEIRADKARDFIGRRHGGREQEGKGTQESRSATWLKVSGFMGMGLVSGLSLANHSDSASFLVAHASLISSVFLPRTSCYKMTHVNGY